MSGKGLFYAYFTTQEPHRARSTKFPNLLDSGNRTFVVREDRPQCGSVVTSIEEVTPKLVL
jgi:hypothetical protein